MNKKVVLVVVLFCLLGTPGYAHSKIMWMENGQVKINPKIWLVGMGGLFSYGCYNSIKTIATVSKQEQEDETFNKNEHNLYKQPIKKITTFSFQKIPGLSAKTAKICWSIQAGIFGLLGALFLYATIS